MKRNIIAILMLFCMLLLCSCGRYESAPNRDSEKEDFEEGTKPPITSEDKYKGTTEETHITKILCRYIDGVNHLGENASIRVFGPVTLDRNFNFYQFRVDTIPGNKYGIYDTVNFYLPENKIVEKSFSITFSKDYDMNALRQFVALTIYAVESDITYETAEKEMHTLIANYDNNAPSNLYIGNEYCVYVTPANIVSGYTVEAVHLTESNTVIDKNDFQILDHSAMASELNKGVECYITATPYEIIVNYPYAYIKVKDLQGNLYYLSGTYNNVLNNIEIDQQYNFYFVLAGKTINGEIYCGLRYFEQSQD